MTRVRDEGYQRAIPLQPGERYGIAGLMLVLLIGLTGCVGAGAMTAVPGATATGEASYYADKFIGRSTSSGERYDPRAMTAAHRTLPFGTKVRVTRLSDGRSVVVRINDRGPFVRGRIIDLSHAAAGRLGILQEGVATVQIEVVSGTSVTPSEPAPDRRASW